MSDKYAVLVRVEINKLREDNGYTGERFTTSEEFVFENLYSFSQIAQILGAFNALAVELHEDGIS